MGEKCMPDRHICRAKGGANRHQTNSILISGSSSRVQFWVSGQPMVTWSWWKYKWSLLDCRKWGNDSDEGAIKHMSSLCQREQTRQVVLGRGLPGTHHSTRQLCEWLELLSAPIWSGIGWYVLAFKSPAPFQGTPIWSQPRWQRSVSLVKMATLEGQFYGIVPFWDTAYSSWKRLISKEPKPDPGYLYDKITKSISSPLRTQGRAFLPLCCGSLKTCLLVPRCLQACWQYSLCEWSFSPRHCRGECFCTMRLSPASMLESCWDTGEVTLYVSSHKLPRNSAFRSSSKRPQGWPSGFF